MAPRPSPTVDREVAAFLAANPDLDLATFDFHDRAAVARLHLPRRSAALIAKLRARQRVRRIAPDDHTAEALIAAGLDSAHRVAVMAEHRFVSEHAGLFGGDRHAAALTHQRARSVKAAVSHVYANLHGTLGSPHYTAMHGGNVDPALGAYFGDVPSYPDLFGTLDHLRCPHCASIFGPAAYFTDLMRITDEYVTDANPDIPAGHTLAQRRPDLFETPLTCANTNESRPMLDIVNTILARRVAAAGQLHAGTVVAATADTLTLDELASPRDHAYTGLRVTITKGTGVGEVRTVTAYAGGSRVAAVDRSWSPLPDASSEFSVAPDPYAILAGAPYPFNLPWNLPLAQVRRNLSVLRTDLPEIYGALPAGTAPAAGGTEAPAADRETCGLSVEQYRIVTTPVTDPATLAAYYGMPALDLPALSKVDTFCATTGLDRDRLAELLTQDVAEQAMAADFFINATGEGPPMAIDRHDTIIHLTRLRLDRLNRFIRLAAALDWDYTALDWALRCDPHTGGRPAIDAARISLLAGIARLTRTMGLGVFEVCAQWSDLKTVGRDNLFDRVYNQPAVLAGQNPYTSATPIPFDPGRPLTWNPARTDRTDGTIRARLLSALGVTDDDLTLLAAHLRVVLGVDGPFRLDLTTLTWFYRLASAARAFRLTVDAYLTLLTLTEPPGKPPVTPTVGVLQLRHERVEWLRRSGFTAHTLLYVLRGTRTSFFRPPYTPDDLAPFIARLSVSAEGSRLTPDSFGFTGIDADASAGIFAALAAERAITPLGILLGDAQRYLDAARRFPLTAGSFVAGNITREQSRQAFDELCAADPPVLDGPDKHGDALLSRSFTDSTDLGYLFDGEPAGANQRGQVRTILSDTKRRIEITAFAFLFPIGPDRFTGRRIDPAASARAFRQLVAHDPALIRLDPAAGQRRVITAYDGETRTATVARAWNAVPTSDAEYRVSVVTTTRAARGGTLSTVVLAEDADPVDGAYTGASVRIVTGDGAGQEAVVTAYDGETRTATVAPPWLELPGDGSGYQLIVPAVTGRVAGADEHTLRLGPGASTVDGAYVDDEVDIGGPGRLGAAYDVGTPLDFLFLSKGIGQRRRITGYDGAARRATVDTAWITEPDGSTYYRITDADGRIVAEGGARGGGPDVLYLSPSASELSDAYLDLTLTLVADPAAGQQRAEVGQALQGTLAFITHTAGVVGAAGALQQSVAAQGLADLLGTTTERLAVLVPAATRVTSLANYLDDLLSPIRDGQVPADVPPFVEALSRGLVLFDTLGMRPDQISAVTELPKAFNVTDVAHPTIDEIVSLSGFMALERRLGDVHGDLIGYFRRPDDRPSGAPAAPGPKVAALSALSGWPVEQIVTLTNVLWPARDGRSAADATTADGVARLAAVFDIGTRTGLDADSLLSLAALAYLPAADAAGGVLGEHWRTYTDAAQLTLDAVGARFHGPEFTAVEQESTGVLGEARRDALLGYVIWKLGLTDPSSLYEYLLIDAQVAGCATTSTIAQGIAAVQLYLQRCRLMLEPGVTDLSNIPEAWWEWMSTYRQWEANRKVFLYPENYLNPALRSDVTPSFEKLSRALMEGDITAASTEAAFRGYVDDFASVAGLVVVDAYQTRLPRTGTSVTRGKGTVQAATARAVTLAAPASDLYNEYQDMTIEITAGPGTGQRRRIASYDPAARVCTLTTDWATVPGSASRYVITGPRMVDSLFLIGRSGTDPYTFHHRRCDSDTGWTPWRKVDAAITVPLVTPVYAFDRLFVYWVELSTVGSSAIKAGKTGTPESEPTEITLATVKFTSLDGDGRWCPPQTVSNDTVVDYKVDYAQLPYLKAVLHGNETFIDPALGQWQKPLALHLPAGNVTMPDRHPSGEQVLVGQGLTLRFDNRSPAPAKPDATPMPAQRVAFQNAAYGLANDMHQQGRGASPTVHGYLPFVPWVSVSSASTRTPFRVVNLDPEGSIPRPYTPVINRGPVLLGSHPRPGYLGITESTSINPIFDNVRFDDYPGIRNGPDQYIQYPLLTNVDPAATSVFTVKNLLGSFLIDTGDETFLVRADDPGIRPNSEILTSAAQRPPMPDGFTYLTSGPFTATVPPPALEHLKFRFTRLSTRAARTFPDRLLTGGVPALLSLDTQRMPELPFDRLVPLSRATAPTSSVLDFSGAYGSYLWELFFHGPFLVADALTAGRRFREAKTWLEYIYNPTQPPAPDDDGKTRFWRFLPFRSMDLPTLTQTLADPVQISAYNDDPFNPDAIARLRISAYAKAIVMRYVDNVLDWADDLFSRDTRESVDEATNLYVLAADLLGPRPKVRGECTPPRPATYDDIRASYRDRTLVTGALIRAGLSTAVLDGAASTEDDAYTGAYLQVDGGPAGYITRYDGATRTAHLDAPWEEPPGAGAAYRVFVNGVPQFLIRLENSPPVLAAAGGPVGYADVPFNDIGSYFCVPENDQLVAYWDRTEDRLFKIRNCMNIAGQVRDLALFAAPDSVAETVRGQASGAAAPGVTTQLEPAVPTYRFEVLIQRAKELAGATTQLGAELLSALEKRDAEAMARLRVTQEQTLLGLITSIKQDAVTQAVHNGASLADALASAEHRQRYFSGLVTAGVSAGEQESINSAVSAAALNEAAGVLRSAASIGFAVPQFGSPFAMTYGGIQLGSVITAAAGVVDVAAMAASARSLMSLTMAQYERRASEWQLQADLAGHDIAQIAEQIAVNDAQRASSTSDLAVHLTSIAQSTEVGAFLRDRFTNEQLYQWMAARLSTLHFQTYSLALELARSAQRALQYELDRGTTFVNFGYWDGARRGLLAGEGLLLALNQMEKAYLDANVRPLHIEKTVALSQLDPIALRDLVTTGECVFTLPERLFDGDYPGLYARKIVSVSVSVPAITGPYQNLHATLTQLANQVVVAPDVKAVDFLLGGASATLPGADVLRTDWRVNQQIALSNGLGDTGMFDGGGDGRYLPFEGTGAVSTWRLRLPRQTNHFDFDAISDVIVALRYQARDGGPRFRDQVVRLPAMSTYDGSVTLSLSQAFSGAWYEFLHQPTDTARQTLRFELARLVPPHISDAVLTGFSLHLQTPEGIATAGKEPYLALSLGTGLKQLVNLDAAGNHTQLLTDRPRVDTVEGAATLSFVLDDTPPGLLASPPPHLDPQVVENVALVLFYQGRITWDPSS
ncbi:neuraminidase-like domain-containing protein [Dactylosporangium siamense]|uniref:Insecticidal toxin complex protein n=1 Tax=Dactylosporangium siamense TaxID=685454 RepID=A0A919PWN6_9ACTN|nr:neuraminidase-like domain-containing protein [Dactylosporangium siamense]GIG49988.1 hypothetical protein Dsi01nite_080290 [Dactylosporangium siamense]